ncbi:GNAT family N-acetyltransferase [Pseudoalteromonas sp. SSDWG2]|uniref:GNAT family N-acetyltransferase n=1 Tax=Pseudoalteromonas sp. SSDWG2 TaxID=3139391 RepID=UPI003BA9FCAB
MNISWHSKTFSELNTHELFTLMRARVDVFVVEQNCPYPELDDADIDSQTVHIMGYVDGTLAAYARCLQKQEKVAIGRVLCVENMRGKGLATALMGQALAVCAHYFPKQQVMLSAQTYLIDFYSQLGFSTQGERYLEDGIEHQDMLLTRPD